MKTISTRIAAVWILSACVSCPAGVIIELVPTPPPYEPWSDETYWVYGDFEHAVIDVHARLDGSGPDSIAIRSMQLDLGNTSPALELYAPAPNAPPGVVFLWDFSSTGVCQNDPFDCGLGYHADGSVLTDTVFRIDYLGDSSNSMEQITLTQSSTHIGSIEVSGFAGAYVLDLVSPWSNPLSGASVSFGFDTPSDPVGQFSALAGTIKGGRTTLVFVPEPTTMIFAFLGSAVLLRRTMRYS